MAILSMKNSWLVQRLEPQFEPRADFEFGAGIGGSNESRKLVKHFCRFEYMGSAEFEFGTIPDAFEKLGKEAADLTAMVMAVNRRQVFVICYKSMVDQVKDRILALSSDTLRLKEWSYFPEVIGTRKSLMGSSHYKSTVGGWS